MSIKVSVKDKQQFVQMILTNYHFEKREVSWILNYIFKKEELLTHIHFVSEVDNCPRSMVLSTSCSNDVPFMFFKGNVTTSNPHVAYHDLRLNEDEAMYIQINMSSKYNNSSYYLALEDNPFLLEKNDPELVQSFNVEEVLDTMLFTTNQRYLQKKIDQALDEANYDLFIHLSKELKLLKDKISE